MGRKKSKVQAAKRNKSQDNKSLSPGITLSDLNDDCLRCILAYLPLKDKFTLQRVSKRWQSLMPWNGWYGKEELEISHNTFRLGTEGWMPFSLLNLKKVLDRCGKFIKDIEIGYLSEEDTNDTTIEALLKLLTKSCPTLESFATGGLELTKPMIELLIQNLADLKSIGIGDTAKGCENKISKLFSKAKNLCSVKIHNSNLKGNCLTALPLASIEEFDILGSDELMLSNVYKALKKMDNLKILHLTDNLKLIENIDQLLKNLPNRSKLENLLLHIIDIPDMNFMYPDRERLVSMKNVGQLTNLQYLLLNGPQVVHDESLTIIGNTCKNLKRAALTDSHTLTDAGWQNFAKLTNLEDLRIGELYTITEKCLLCLQTASLKTLTCFRIDLNNQSLQHLLKSAQSLDKLDVALCPKVDYATLIKDASALIDSRPDHGILRLCIDLEENTGEMTNISSRLLVEQTTNYVVQLYKRHLQMAQLFPIA